jgi:hypothetical protein
MTATMTKRERKAVAYAAKGLALAKGSPEAAGQARELGERLALYRSRKPYRQTPGKHDKP